MMRVPFRIILDISLCFLVNLDQPIGNSSSTEATIPGVFALNRPSNTFRRRPHFIPLPFLNHPYLRYS